MAVSKILLDTNAYAAFKNGFAEAVSIVRHGPLIGMSSIVLGELRGGFAVGTREEMNIEELKRFLTSQRVRVFSVDDDTARCYANVYRKLRQKGKPIPTNDIWIAATALQYDLAVFSYDNHFKEVEGLRTGNQLADFLY